MAKAWLPLLRAVCPEAPVVFDTVDLHFLREIREVPSPKVMTMMPHSQPRRTRHLIAKYPNLQNTKTWRSYEEGYNNRTTSDERLGRDDRRLGRGTQGARGSEASKVNYGLPSQ